MKKLLAIAFVLISVVLLPVSDPAHLSSRALAQRPMVPLEHRVSKNPFVSKALYEYVSNAAVRFTVYTEKHTDEGALITPTTSGTVIASRQVGDEAEIAVLSCWHGFSLGAVKVLGSFPQGFVAEGELHSYSIKYDLALVLFKTDKISADKVAVISLSQKYVTTAEYSEDDEEGEVSPVGFFGYGKSGRYYCGKGTFLGYASASHNGNGVAKNVPPKEGDKYHTNNSQLKITGFVIPGDSGGGMLNEHGELVGVIWGSPGGTVFGSSLPVIEGFLRNSTEKELTQWVRDPRYSRPRRGDCPPDCRETAPPIVTSPPPVDSTPAPPAPPGYGNPDPPPDGGAHNDINDKLDSILSRLDSMDDVASKSDVARILKAIDEIDINVETEGAVTKEDLVLLLSALAKKSDITANFNRITAILDAIVTHLEEHPGTGGGDTDVSLSTKLLKEILLLVQRNSGDLGKLIKGQDLLGKDHDEILKQIKELGFAVKEADASADKAVDGLDQVDGKLDEAAKDHDELMAEIKSLRLQIQRTEQTIETFTKTQGSGKMRFRLKFNEESNSYEMEPRQ